MKKNKIQIVHRSSIQNTLNMMPRYYAYQCGYGIHGQMGYNKRIYKKEAKKVRKEYGF